MTALAFLALVAGALWLSFLAGVHRGRNELALSREGLALVGIAFTLIALVTVLP